MGCVEHSVQAEGGGRNVAWGVAYGWGLGIPPSCLNGVTMFKQHVRISSCITPYVSSTVAHCREVIDAS